MSQPVYVLGHSEHELQRLIEQGRFYGELTEDLLRRAGIKPGMRVLDVGSGAGDVSFLVASMVGHEGQVHGIDKSAEAVALASARAEGARLSNVSFSTGDLESYRSDAPFDAVVGRLVLIYLSDPAAALQNLAQNLKAGGILAFVELEVSYAKSVPPTPLFSQCVGWLIDTFTRASVQVDMGTRLYRTFRQAGLPSPTMLMLGRVEAGENSATYENLVQSIRSLLPAMEKFGLATAEEVSIDTLAERLRAEAVAHEAVVLPPPAVAAWLRLP